MFRSRGGDEVDRLEEEKRGWCCAFEDSGNHQLKGHVSTRIDSKGVRLPSQQLLPVPTHHQEPHPPIGTQPMRKAQKRSDVADKDLL